MSVFPIDIYSEKVNIASDYKNMETGKGDARKIAKLACRMLQDSSRQTARFEVLMILEIRSSELRGGDACSSLASLLRFFAQIADKINQRCILHSTFTKPISKGNFFCQVRFRSDQALHPRASDR